MIVLGIVLLIIGAVANIGILWAIGGILVVLGVIFWILGAMGARSVAARLGTEHRNGNEEMSVRGRQLRPRSKRGPAMS